MPVNHLIQQNGLDENCLIRIGQTLTLTFATPAPAISPTPIVAQTPTPRAGYPAPQLVSPVEGEGDFRVGRDGTLAWLSIGLLKENEWYVVQVQPSGAITVPVFETKATSIKLTRSIFGDPEQALVRLVGAGEAVRSGGPAHEPARLQRPWARPVRYADSPGAARRHADARAEWGLALPAASRRRPGRHTSQPCRPRRHSGRRTAAAPAGHATASDRR